MRPTFTIKVFTFETVFFETVFFPFEVLLEVVFEVLLEVLKQRPASRVWVIVSVGQGSTDTRRRVGAPGGTRTDAPRGLAGAPVAHPARR